MWLKKQPRDANADFTATDCKQRLREASSNPIVLQSLAASAADAARPAVAPAAPAAHDDEDEVVGDDGAAPGEVPGVGPGAGTTTTRRVWGRRAAGGRPGGAEFRLQLQSLVRFVELIRLGPESGRWC